LGHTPRALGAAAVFASAVLLTTVAGCGKDASTGKASASHPAAKSAKPVTCAQLYARLQQVTATISASSELIANSLNPQQLSQRIAAEEKVLSQSAEVRGDFQAAVTAMGDKTAVQKIVAASAAIEKACN
jgi:hypothetical protein